LSNYVLTCCSTADMPREFFEKKNIPFETFHFHMDGEDYPDDLGRSMPFEEFYQRIENGAMPTTSQVNVGQFIDFFEPFLKEGQDILHLSFSSGLSGTYNSAILAQQQLVEQYPERKLIVIDTLAASSGYGLLIDLAFDLKDGGATIDELSAWVGENKLKLQHWFFSTDLSHFRRGGRISAASAVVGGLLNICPLMNVNHEGKLIQRQKVRGKKQVISAIVKKMKEHADNGLEYSGKCFISHSACLDDAKEVAMLIERDFPNLDGPVVINSIGTVIGSHTGPGTVALFFMGDKRID